MVIATVKNHGSYSCSVFLSFFFWGGGSVEGCPDELELNRVKGDREGIEEEF